jgi:valyl-tRNA synthetase
MNVEGQDLRADGAELTVADRWIRSRLAAALARVESGFADYRLDGVASALYEFTWHEFCDWYLELSKAVLQSETSTDAEKRGTRLTLINTLETLLRALHPLAPFISEEIWQRVRVSTGVGGAAAGAGVAAGAGDGAGAGAAALADDSRATIMLAPYPAAAAAAADPAAEQEMRWVMDFILGVRQIRGEMDIAPSRKLDVLLQNAAAADIAYLRQNLGSLVRLAGITPPRVLEAAQAAPISAVALLGTLEILVPMAGLIDPAAELDRLSKRRRNAEIDLKKLEGKLANVEFSKNAPAEIVAKDSLRLAELRTEIGQLQAQLARVSAMRAQ